MSINGSSFDQASFLHPRDPSILFPYQRPRLASPVKKQLFSSILEGEQHANTNEIIRTYLRLKPADRTDKSHEAAAFSILDENTVVTNPPKDSAAYKNHPVGRAVHQFTFTKVFRPDVEQKDLFEECVSGQMRDFIRGNNCLLFAYGTTNAGKTYTVQGTGEQPGIIPRALDMLFKSIRERVASCGLYKPDRADSVVQLDSSTLALEAEYKNRILQWNWDKPFEPLKHQSTHSNLSESDFISNTFREMQKTLDDSCVEVDYSGDVIYGVWVSFVEVYNECVYDLLEPIGRGRKRIPLKLAQEDGHVFVRDLKSIHVSSGDEAFQVMLYGKANLQIACTNMNSRSSRSHCIFTIRLVRYFNSSHPTYAHLSSFSFCDLAGAERVKKTLNVGERLKESNNINTSLHVLGRCIMAIRENQGRRDKRPVPFRDSKLTRLFQRALTGHSQISMIVNVSPSAELFDETVNVLKFSAVAKQILFEPSIKPSKPRNLKKSRFSRMVLQPKTSGPICWDSVQEENTISSEGSSFHVHQSRTNNEELLSLVDTLKLQLQQERDKNISLERDLRKELANNFSKIMQEMDNTYKNRIQDLEERNSKVNTWRMEQLEAYYKEKLEEGSRKRRRESDSDEIDSHVNQIKELEEELHHMESKFSAIQQLLSDSKDEQSVLLAENSKLKFDLSTLTMELENCQRALSASQKDVKGDERLLLAELELQLSGEKRKVAELEEKNKSFIRLLEEAGADFLLVNSEKNDAEEKVSELEQALVEKECEVAEYKNSLEASQVLIHQKTLENEELEDKLEKACKDLTNLEGSQVQKHHYSCDVMEQLLEQLRLVTVSDAAKDGGVEAVENGKVSESSGSLLGDIHAQIKTIRDTLQSNSILASEHERLKSQFALLSNHIEEEVSKVVLLSEQLDSANKEVQKNKDLAVLMERKHEDLTARIQELEEQLSKHISERESKLSTIGRSEGEIKTLQKEIKNLLQQNTALTNELESSQQKVTCLEQELKTALQMSVTHFDSSRASQNELESLRLIVKTSESSVNAVNALREELQRSNEEASRLRHENEQLKDQIKNQESEMKSYENNRMQLMNRYEEALRKSHEETELQKREVLQLQKALYKSTPTPNKSDPMVAHRPKELENSCTKQGKILLSENKPSVKRQTRNAKKGIDFSSESLKENVVEQSCSSSQAFQKDNNLKTPFSTPLEKTSQASSVKANTEEKRRRGQRKLFTRSEIDSAQDFEVEEVPSVRSTTPDSYMKRLRNRKV